MYRIEDDGKTHINIYSKGATPLGRALSNFTLTPFVHPNYGRFQSLEGFWFFLLTGDDEFRKLHGYKAKNRGQQVSKQYWLKYESLKFRSDYMSGLVCKLEQTPRLMDRFKSSILPFTHYYVYNGVAVEPRNHKWLVPMFEMLRTH